MTNTKQRLVFAGTPEFAATSLAALIACDKYDLCAVYTQPDRPAGRGRKLQSSPVKQLAQKHQIPIYQPESLKTSDALRELQALNADLVIVAAYGLLLPQAALDAPRLGCINIHASLLPRWRGAAPIQRAIAAGDTETGISIMQMVAGLDAGPVLHHRSCPITEDETGGSLHDKLACLGAETLLDCLDDCLAAKLPAIAQNESLAIYADKLNKQEALIDWHQSAEQIVRKIRAFNPWPVAHGQVGDTAMRIWDASALDKTASQSPGSIINIDREGIELATGSGVVRLLQIQLAGKKAVSVRDYVNSNQNLIRC